MPLLRPYLQLLRLPNLFTVPGDPLCGFLLASHGALSWHVLPAMLMSLCAYCVGLITNDLADYKEDLRDRPTRPLPSDAIPLIHATGLAAIFTALTLMTAAEFTTAPAIRVLLALLAVILFYNLVAKKSAIAGPIFMGLCRGLSVLLGAAAAVPFAAFDVTRLLREPAGFAACLIGLYIAAVTALARTETRDPRIPPLIGVLIRALLFVQAVFCAAAGGLGWAAALLLLALWPVSRLVGSRFYAS